MTFSIFKKFVKRLSRYGVDKAEYCSTYALYVLEDPQKKEAKLLTNHHIYMLMRESGQTEFTVETVNTIEEADKYLSIDRFNAMLLCNALENTKSQSNSAARHQLRRAAGQICPLCGGPLELQNGKSGKILIDGLEFRRVRCNYRNKNGIRCNFQAYLNLKGVELFRKHKYPTDKWLIKTSICHNCQEPVYELKQEIGSTLQICFGRKGSRPPGEYCRYDRLPDK